MRFRLRTCSACGGELELDHDAAGPYVECVRCGLDQETLRTRRSRVGQARLVAATPAPELVGDPTD